MLKKYPTPIGFALFTASLSTLSDNKILQSYSIDFKNIGFQSRWTDLKTFLDLLPQLSIHAVSLQNALFSLSQDQFRIILTNTLLGAALKIVDLSKNELSTYPKPFIEDLIQFLKKNTFITSINIQDNGIDCPSTNRRDVITALENTLK